MAIQLGHELYGPGDVNLTGADNNLSRGLGRNSAPLWEVGNPVAVAFADLQQESEAFAATYDATKANSFITSVEQELNAKYNDPKTGEYQTRQGANAQGMYSDLVEQAKFITDERAVKELNQRQRNLISDPLSNLFNQYGRQVGSFETTQLMNAQLDENKNAITAAQTGIAQAGELTPEGLAFAHSRIATATANIGLMLGHSPETIDNATRAAFGTTVKNGIAAYSIKDPTNAFGALRVYRDLMHPAEYAEIAELTKRTWDNAMIQEANQVYNERGIEGAREFLESHNSWVQAASANRAKESGGNPSAVNMQDSGGMSFGLYQFHIGNGVDIVKQFGEYLSDRGNPEVLARMTGKKGRNAATEWKSLVAEGLISDADQTKFARDVLVLPYVDKLSPELQDKIDGNYAYREAVWSTMITHGGPRAVEIISKAHERSGGNGLNFINLLYEDRSKRFTKGTQAQRNATLKTLAQEHKRLAGVVGAEGAGGGNWEGSLSLPPKTERTLLRSFEASDRSRSVGISSVSRAIVPEAVAQFLATGNSQVLDQAQEALAAFGEETPEMLEFKTQRELIEKVMPFINDNTLNGLPLREQRALAQEKLASLRTDGNYDQVNKMYAEVDKHFKALEESFKKDPSLASAHAEASLKAYKAIPGMVGVTPAPLGSGSASSAAVSTGDPLNVPDPRAVVNEQVNKELAKETNPVESSITRSLEWQRRVSGDPNFKGKVFSGPDILAHKTFFEDPNLPVRARLEKMNQISLNLGVHASQGFQELGLSYTDYASVKHMEANGVQTRSEVEVFNTAGSLKWAQIYSAGDDQVDNEAKLASYEAADKVPFVQVEKQIAALNKFSPEAVKNFNEVRDTIAKMIALGQEDSVEKLNNAYEYILPENSDFGSLLTLPTNLGLSVEDVEAGGVAKLEELYPVLAEHISQTMGASGVDPLFIGNTVNNLSNHMVLASIGGGNQVMVFFDGVPMRTPEGELLVWEAAELDALGKQAEELKAQTRGRR